MKKTFWILMFGFLIAGCATAPQAPVYQASKIENLPAGTYHQVQKGETLWRISKMYRIDMDEIVSVNHIPEASSIEVGQLVFIPTTKKPAVLPQVNTPLASSGDDFIWPLKGKVISRFGETVNHTKNKGIDIQSGYGRDVYSSRDGVVAFYSDELKGFGETLIIQHDDVFSTVYARNSQVLVKVGDRVKQGDVIAKVGNAGRDNSPYLHFEIRKRHVSQNPNYYLP